MLPYLYIYIFKLVKPNGILYRFDRSPWDKEGEGFDGFQVSKAHPGDVDILKDVHAGEDGVNHEPVPGHGGHLSGVSAVKPHCVSGVWTLRTSKPITNQTSCKNMVLVKLYGIAQIVTVLPYAMSTVY